MKKEYFDEDYFERGAETGKSLYSHYRWMPELTIPMCHHLINTCDITRDDTVLDFGCAKGYVTYGFRLLGINAYGVDISEYPLSKAPKEVEQYLTLIKPYEKLPKKEYSWGICKDILEHIPYDGIKKQLQILYEHCENIFIIVPLGDGERYYIDSYEHDKSHYIREDLVWWHEMLQEVGYSNVKSTYDLGPFKKNWNFEKRGNGMIIGNKVEGIMKEI